MVHGLHFCATVGFKNVVIESDAQGVLAALDSQMEDLGVDGNLVHEAKLLMSCFDSCSRSFIPREGNKAAHKVARVALSCQFPTYWRPSVPDWLVNVIDSEACL